MGRGKGSETVDATVRREVGETDTTTVGGERAVDGLDHLHDLDTELG